MKTTLILISLIFSNLLLAAEMKYSEIDSAKLDAIEKEMDKQLRIYSASLNKVIQEIYQNGKDISISPDLFIYEIDLGETTYKKIFERNTPFGDFEFTRDRDYQLFTGLLSDYISIGKLLEYLGTVPRLNNPTEVRRKMLNNEIEVMEYEGDLTLRLVNIGREYCRMEFVYEKMGNGKFTMGLSEFCD